MREGENLYLLLAIILASGFLLLLFYSGPYYAFDDRLYLLYAHQITNGTFNFLESPYAYGYLMPALVALSFLLFGSGITSSLIPMALAYFLIIILAYVIARRLYGGKAALLSALLSGTAPFVLGNSTRILPDMLLGVIAGVSIYLMISAGSSKRKGLLYFFSGIFASLTIYVKLIGLAYVLVFLIAVISYSLMRDEGKAETKSHPGAARPKGPMSKKSIILILAGLAIPIIANLFVTYLSTGNALYTLVAYGQNQNAISHTTLLINTFTFALMTFGIFSINWIHGTLFQQVIDPQIYPLGLMILWSAASFLIGWHKRDRSVTYLSVLTFGFLLYMFFGSETISAYSFIAIQSRYFTLVIIPMAILASYAIIEISDFVGTVFKKRGRRMVLTFLIAATLASNLPVYGALYNYNRSIAGDMDALSSLYSYLAPNPRNPDFSLLSGNENYSMALGLLSSYKSGASIATLSGNGTEAIGEMKAFCSHPGGYLLLGNNPEDAAYLSNISGTCVTYRLRAFYSNEPPDQFDPSRVNATLYIIK